MVVVPGAKADHSRKRSLSRLGMNQLTAKSDRKKRSSDRKKRSSNRKKKSSIKVRPSNDIWRKGKWKSKRYCLTAVAMCPVTLGRSRMNYGLWMR